MQCLGTTRCSCAVCSSHTYSGLKNPSTGVLQPWHFSASRNCLPPCCPLGPRDQSLWHLENRAAESPGPVPPPLVVPSPLSLALDSLIAGPANRARCGFMEFPVTRRTQGTQSGARLGVWVSGVRSTLGPLPPSTSLVRPQVPCQRADQLPTWLSNLTPRVGPIDEPGRL